MTKRDSKSTNLEDHTDDDQEKTLAHLIYDSLRTGEKTVAQLIESTGCSVWSIRSRLSYLKQAGRVQSRRLRGEDGRPAKSREKIYKWVGPPLEQWDQRSTDVPEKRKKAVQMYRRGATLSEIGEEFDVSRERVRQWLSFEGLSGRTFVFDELGKLRKRVEDLERHVGIRKGRSRTRRVSRVNPTRSLRQRKRRRTR